MKQNPLYLTDVKTNNVTYILHPLQAIISDILLSSLSIHITKKIQLNYTQFTFSPSKTRTLFCYKRKQLVYNAVFFLSDFTQALFIPLKQKKDYFNEIYKASYKIHHTLI